MAQLTAPPIAAAPVPPGQWQIDHSLMQGIAWSGGMTWLTQVLRWGSTLIVARLLTPGDYGLVEMAGVYLGFVLLLSEFGLSPAIIQQRDLNEDQLARVGGLAALVGASLVAVSLVVAGPIAAFFGEEAVRGIVTVLSVTFLTRALQVLPRSLLARDLQFRRLAWLDGVEAFTLAVATCLLAVLGFRYWALVIGGVTSGVVATICAAVWRPHRLAWPRELGSIARTVTFGWQTVVSQVAWYAYSNAPFAIVGRVLGKAALGAYGFAWTIANIPVDRVSATLGRVTSAVLAAVQNDPPALRRYVCNVTEGLALITFPAAAGIAMVADEFVTVVLGDGWRPVVAPLRLLALYAGVRSVMTVLPQLFLATGHPRRSMQLSLWSAAVLPPVFYVGSLWGTTGVALAWLVGYPVVVLPFLVRHAFPLIGLRPLAYLETLRPATVGTVAMAAAMLVVRVATPTDWSPAWRLATQVLAGAATYLAVVHWTHGPRVRTFMTLLRDSWRPGNRSRPTHPATA